MIEVYCLPGTMCDERLWQQVEHYLPADIRLIHITYPIEADLEVLLRKLMQKLPQTPFHILGFSLGGYLVSELARLIPERLASVTIVSNVAAGLPDEERQQRLQALNWVERVGYKGIPTKKAAAMLSPKSADVEVLVQRIKDMDSALGEDAFLAQLRATLDRRDNYEVIEKSPCRWMVLFGIYDQFINPDALHRVKGLANVCTHSIADCGHMLPLEQPKWMASRLQKFLRAEKAVKRLN